MEAFSDQWSAYVASAQLGGTALHARPSFPVELAKPSSPRPQDPSAFKDRDLGVIPAPHGVGTAEHARRVFEREGWMPAVNGPHEEERLRVLRRFGLRDVGQIDAVDKIAETARMIFGTKVVTVSCMLEDRGMFVTTRGWCPDEMDPNMPRLHVGLEASVCHHAVQKSAQDGCFILPSAREDWRFAQSPYVRPGGPINFFASANINLPTLRVSPTREVIPDKLPIGSLCIVDPEARTADAMSERDQTILKNLADLIAREFELGFERKRGEAVKAQIGYLGELFKSLSTGSAALAENEKDAFAHVADNLASLTNASYCTIIDLRAFRCATSPAPVPSTSSPATSRRSTVPPRQSSGTPATSVESNFSADAPVSSITARPPLIRNSSTESSSLATYSSLDGEGGKSSSDEPASSTRSSSTLPGSRRRTPSSVSAERTTEDELLSRLGRRKHEREGEGRLAVLNSSAGAEWDWEEALGLRDDEGLGESADEEEKEKAKRNAERKVRASEARKAVARFLVDYVRTGESYHDLTSPTPGALAPILPPSTTSSLTVPCFFDGESTLLIVLGSTVRHFQFELQDKDFASNVGSVLLGSLLRRRLLEADRAKLHFLSQISHELRTPLFGIGSYLEIAREVGDPKALASINPLLSMADVCVTSLRDILDSVLSFSKLAHADVSAALSSARSTSASATSFIPPGGSASGPAHCTVDLEGLLCDVVKSCWTGTRAKAKAMQAAAMHDEGSCTPVEKEEKLDIILEFDLPKGIKATLDTGAFRRVLINLLGNSIKYTSGGSIVVAVSAPTLKGKKGVAQILIDIADTGMGMTPEFLRDRLLLPFQQEDPFKAGVGLGVSIADSLVRNMGGTLSFSSVRGSGTTASVAVPLEIVVPDDVDLVSPLPLPSSSTTGLGAFPSRPKVQRRILSDELIALLEPLTLNSSPAPSPISSPAPPAPPAPTVIKLASTAPDFTPPYTPPTSTSTSPASSPAAAPTVLSEARPLTVLVADDNPIARRVLTTYLKTRLIPFVEASDGLQAVERFKEVKPDVCWLDVQMPNLDGIGASRRMREVERQEVGRGRARIVAITGLSAALGDYARVLESGQIDLWLSKSGSLKQLTADLEAFRATMPPAPEPSELSTALAAFVDTPSVFRVPVEVPRASA
ncbi:hypothetical protein JCM8547_003037 [Rhodosporidiobolus lusitaniae]